jgi:phage host-nuclease inhibitor protein Gam
MTDALIEYQDETDPTVRGPWEIENLGTLAWALERMGELTAETQENDALKLQAIARLEARVTQLNARAKGGIEFFRARILSYMARARPELLKGGKKKSRALPSGTIGWRSKGGRLVVQDEDAALAWAKEQPVEADFVRVKFELNRKALAELFKTTGEVPPGCDVEAEYDDPYIDPVVPTLSLTQEKR